jgi:hypothetical protein
LPARKTEVSPLTLVRLHQSMLVYDIVPSTSVWLFVCREGNLVVVLLRFAMLKCLKGLPGAFAQRDIPCDDQIC